MPTTTARQQRRFSYRIKDLGPGVRGLDAGGGPPLEVDEGSMCATGVLATTTRDRDGDVFVVTGCDTSDHERNPIVLLDHGLYHPLPIGVTRDGAGRYTVWSEGDKLLQTTHFSQSSETAEQVFALIAEGVLRACSVGFVPIERVPLRPDPERGFRRRKDGTAGHRVLRSKLVEASWTGTPCNPDAVMATLSKGRLAGRPLAYAVKSLLSRYAPPRRAWSHGADLGAQAGKVVKAADLALRHNAPAGMLRALRRAAGSLLTRIALEDMREGRRA